MLHSLRYSQSTSHWPCSGSRQAVRFDLPRRQMQLELSNFCESHKSHLLGSARKCVFVSLLLTVEKVHVGWPSPCRKRTFTLKVLFDRQPFELSRNSVDIYEGSLPLRRSDRATQRDFTYPSRPGFLCEDAKCSRPMKTKERKQSLMTRNSLTSASHDSMNQYSGSEEPQAAVWRDLTKYKRVDKYMGDTSDCTSN